MFRVRRAIFRRRRVFPPYPPFSYFSQVTSFLRRWEKVEKIFQKSRFFARSLLSDCARFGIIRIIRSCAPRRFADDAFGSSPDAARFTDAATSSKRDKIRLRVKENLKFVRRNVDTSSKEKRREQSLSPPRFFLFPILPEPSISATIRRSSAQNEKKSASRFGFRIFRENRRFDGAAGDDV